MFFGILIFESIRQFFKGYSLCKSPIFKMVSFLEYLVFFQRVFCTELFQSACTIDFCMFFRILIFDPNRQFGKGYSLCKMADFFKMVSFLEYLVFFQRVFCTELFQSACRIDFCMFFRILIFDPNRQFGKGYSLCKMADFFKMVSFLEYLVFFRAVFCTELL